MQNKPIFLAGFPVIETPKQDLANYLFERLAVGKKSILFFANTNFVVNCRSLLPRMFDDNVVIVNDGIGMDIGSLLVNHRKFKTNLNGTDFTPYFFKQSQTPLFVFLLGSKPDVITKAAYFLSHELGQKVVGSCDGYDGINKQEELVQIINASNADIVLVGMGNPIQEEWILNNYRLLNANLIFGVGGIFDFWSGDKPRAPLLIQNIRMEWFYRLSLEPKRLIKRYTIDAVKFLILCFTYRKKNV